MIERTAEGLYCRAADAWVDPWRPVPRALITHAHADHARAGCGEYWAVDVSEGVLRQRLGQEICLHPVRYGEPIWLGQCRVSFHSAGHVLGSAQIRLESEGEVWVVSGDYKRDDDPSCAPFEPVTCDVLITEATFGMPIYRWKPGYELATEIRDWWQGDRSRPSLLFCYAFGKAQRLLAELKAIGVDDEVLLHGAVETVTRHYRQAAVPMTPSRPVSDLKEGGSGRPPRACPAVSPPIQLDEAVPHATNRLCLRLDGGARRSPQAGLRTRIRAERSRGLAWPDPDRARIRGQKGLRDPWSERCPGPLPEGGGRDRCRTAGDPVRGRKRLRLLRCDQLSISEIQLEMRCCMPSCSASPLSCAERMKSTNLAFRA